MKVPDDITVSVPCPACGGMVGARVVLGRARNGGPCALVVPVERVEVEPHVCEDDGLDDIVPLPVVRDDGARTPAGGF